MERGRERKKGKVERGDERVGWRKRVKGGGMGRVTRGVEVREWGVGKKKMRSKGRSLGAACGRERPAVGEKGSREGKRSRAFKILKGSSHGRALMEAFWVRKGPSGHMSHFFYNTTLGG